MVYVNILLPVRNMHYRHMKNMDFSRVHCFQSGEYFGVIHFQRVDLIRFHKQVKNLFGGQYVFNTVRWLYNETDIKALRSYP